LAGGRGLPEQFPELARGCPWAWDEEVVAAAANSQAHQSARLAVASQIAGDAIAEAVLRRDVSKAAGLERDSLGAKDVKAVVARAAARWKAQVSKLQQVAPQQAPLAQPSRPGLAQLVWQLELLALVLLLAGAQQARA
jgi:hypothetical protein